MQLRQFGSIDVKVSAIGFGGAAVSGDAGGYGFGSISESDSIELLRSALDQGINLFDTAPCYGYGESERRIGKAFREIRDQVFLVSKSGVTWDENMRVRKTNDPAVTEKMLNQSLVDLQTDYIDLYMIHWPDDYYAIEDAMQVLVDAQKAGKVRYLGLCNTNPTDIEKASTVGKIDVIQNNYNLFDRSAEKELLPLCASKNMGFMSYGTLDKGILTGKVKPDRKYDKTDVRAVAKWWKQEDRSWKFAAMEKIEGLLEKWQVSHLDLALHGVLRNPNVSTALVGMRKPEYLESTVASTCKNPLNDEQFAEIESIINEHR